MKYIDIRRHLKPYVISSKRSIKPLSHHGPLLLMTRIMGFGAYEDESVRPPKLREATGIRRGGGDAGKAGCLRSPIRGSGTAPLRRVERLGKSEGLRHPAA